LELVDETDWWLLDEGIEVITFYYQVPCWEKSRRIVSIRQKIDEPIFLSWNLG